MSEEVSIRPLAPDELPDINAETRRKYSVAEWHPPKGAVGLRDIRFLVLPLPVGRRFDLHPRLNGCVHMSDMVVEIAKMGYLWRGARYDTARGSISDLELLELYVYGVLMPRMQAFRTRRYRTMRDYEPSEGAASLMPSHLAEPLDCNDASRGHPPGRFGKGKDRSDDADEDLTRCRTYQFRQVTEPIYGDHNIGPLDSAVLWQAEEFAQHRRRRWSRERVRKAVIGSILDLNAKRQEIQRARWGDTARLLATHLRKVAIDETKDLSKVFAGIHNRGYADLWGRSGSPVSRRQFHRDLLCLAADSLWTVSRCWCRILRAVRRSLAGELSPTEALMFDRYYMPQEYLAGLAPLTLCPLREIVINITLKFHNVPREDSWKLYTIPYCLELYRQMDDATRKEDRKRKSGAGASLKNKCPDRRQGQKSPPSRHGTDKSALSIIDLDPDILGGTLQKDPQYCPDCHKRVSDIEFDNGPDDVLIIRMLPCGHIRRYGELEDLNELP